MNPNFWQGQGTPQGRILYGVVGEENPIHPGTYRYSSTCGIVVNDAHILSPDVDNKGGGENTKPRPGSLAVALMTSNGAQCMIVGFHRAPQFDQQKDEIPSVGNPDDNVSAGDKVYRTSGGATLLLKRGGAIVIESGPGVSIRCIPKDARMTLNSSNYKNIADGYSASRGRQEVGGTAPETIHTEDFLHQVGPSYDRLRLQHGNLPQDSRRRLELAAVTVVAGQATVTVKSRETYFSDGSWVGEGPKYQWGGGAANEPAVLGTQLVEAFTTLFGIIKTLKVNTAWGPSTPPLPDTQTKLTQLQSELSGKILSTFMFLSKDPSSL